MAIKKKTPKPLMVPHLLGEYLSDCCDDGIMELHKFLKSAPATQIVQAVLRTVQDRVDYFEQEKEDEIQDFVEQIETLIDQIKDTNGTEYELVPIVKPPAKKPPKKRKR